jgi:hypothetical protein
MSCKEYFEKFRFMEPYISIEKDEWAHILKTYEKEEIVQHLSEVLVEYLPPIPNLDEKDAEKSLKELKRSWWADLLVEGEWFPRNGRESKYPLTYKGKPTYFKKSNLGNNASNTFHVENRWKVDWVRTPSGWKSWQTVEGIKTIVRAYFTLDQVLQEVNVETLRMATTLRKYVASQFRPSVAKAFYDMFKSDYVLDFSAGWGDRLAGFYACGKKYIGIDPNTNNHLSYIHQKQFYTFHRTFFEHYKEAEFYCEPAEDFDFSRFENYFDTVFTSPPYFNTEKYSDEDTQSYKRYRTIEEWNKNFLHKTIENIIPSMKKYGILAINIADVYSAPDKGYVDITNAMNDFIASKGLTYEGCIGMQMTKRFNSAGAGNAVSEYYSDSLKEIANQAKDKDSVFCEPIWIWKKEF